jgi:colicin import membrane protein
MFRDQYGIIPGILSVLVHVLLFSGLFVVFDFSSPVQPAMPLAIQATLVTEEETSPPPPPPPPEPAPEPEPEPEPEPPPPDTGDEERRRLEEEKRLADLRAEQERIRLQQEEDRRRREAEEAERRRRQEEETERLRAEAERRRQEDLERQRAENERLKREAEQAEIERRRQQELDAEQNRLQAMQADDMVRWVFALQQAIARNFVPPASAPVDLECVVDVRQLPGGTVANVSIGRCNGDDAVRRAIEAAVFKASPLPAPENPRIFERDLRITFKPEQ